MLFLMFTCFRYAKTPLGKKRAKLQEGEDDDKGKDKSKKK
jgi:hypothetical protein